MSRPESFPPHSVAIIDQDLAQAMAGVDVAMRLYREAKEEGELGALIDLVAMLGDLSRPAANGLAAAAIVRLVQIEERGRGERPRR
jgi:hypothetical protein